MSAFTPAGSGGAPITVGPSPGTTTPTILNFSIASSATEYSIPLPSGTRRFLLHIREPQTDLQLSYAALDSGTLFLSIPRGNWFSEDGLDPGVSYTLYFQASASATLEVLSWA